MGGVFYFANTLIGNLNISKEYIIAASAFLLLVAGFKVFDFYILRILRKVSRKTKMSFDDVLVDFFKEIHWPFYVYLSFYISMKFLLLPEAFSRALWYVLVLFIAYYVSRGVLRIINHFFDVYVEKKRRESSAEGESMIHVLRIIAMVAVWAIAFLMVLSAFGVDITPLIASLGIGGIAIALALQSILGDLFSAFAIYFDKPFKEGDFIIVGEDMGVVKFIGIKTTRIQALGGQEIVMSNSDLMSARINNYKKMKKRRVAFKFGVEYSTSLQKLKKINKIIQEIIKNIGDAELDRVHFKEFGDFSLNYEVVYYVNSNDYNKFMDIQQEINFKIKERFEKEKISMAFPTQTIFLEKKQDGLAE